MIKNLMDMIYLKSHWNKAYSVDNIKDLGWYEDFSEPPLWLIEKCKFDKNSTLLNIGAGTSALIDDYRFLSVTKKMLHAKLADDFEIIDSFEFKFTNPIGENREYMCTLFKRIK